MSGKSRRKPVRLAVASSSLEELKQEVEDTAEIVQLLMRGSFAGADCDKVRLAIEYVYERNEEAGKTLERLDPNTIVRRKEVAPEVTEHKPEDLSGHVEHHEPLHAVQDANESNE